MTEPLTIICGDALTELRKLPGEGIQCVVTSPPYWGLRDYGTAEWEGGDDACDHLKPFDAVSHLTSGLKLAKNHAEAMSNVGHKHEPYRNKCGKCGARRIDSQLGLEKTPEEYVAKMVEVFREVRRVLRKDGTLWLNMGDSYNTGTTCESKPSPKTDVGYWQNADKIGRPRIDWPGLKPKDLCGIPWRVAFALQTDGWWLRSDIIWSKPNPMPESVTDRPTKSHEYLFLLTKSANYFYDAESIKEPQAYGTFERYGNGERIPSFNKSGGSARKTEQFAAATPIAILEGGRNKRSVWTIATAPYPEAHFATYPPDLVKPCIMAGTSAKGCCASCGAPWERITERGELQGPGFEGYRLPKAQASKDDPMVKGRSEGWWPNHKFETKTLGWQPSCAHRATEGEPTIPCTVLDPFAGSGTTGAVALELGRKAVLIELNPVYAALIEQRTSTTLGLALA